jgi:hypothetical protein
MFPVRFVRDSGMNTVAHRGVTLASEFHLTQPLPRRNGGNTGYP